jgi:GNAT superfamily N-acetyltransferase
MKNASLRPVEIADREWIVDRHIELYQSEYGFDDSFGVLVGQIVTDFFNGFDASREAGWIAEIEGVPMGSIFCTNLTEDAAQLRLFFLRKEARGTGLGRRMLRACMDFAQEAGYREMRLWTHRSHVAACALYRRSGWSCVEAEPTVSFGQQEVIETYVYRF